MPDVHIIWNGLAFWLELKITKDNKIRLSSNQIAWNTKHSLKKGLSYSLIQRGGEGSLFLFRGEDARQLAIDGLTMEPIIKVSGSGFGDIFGSIRESGIKHLESITEAHKDNGQ